MNEENKPQRRWLLVSDGTPQMHYVGTSFLTDDEIDELDLKGEYLLLEDCRSLRTLIMPSPDGVLMQNQITPISLCRGAVRVRIRPTSYVRPDEDEATMKVLSAQIKKCEENELEHRMKEAGLVPADGARVGPRGLVK